MMSWRNPSWTHLSRLIEAALAGEEVVILCGETPVARLTPIPERRFRVGLLRAGLGQSAPDFREALDEEAQRLSEGGA